MQLEHIFDNELVALCRARNLTASTDIEHCIISRGSDWEVMTMAEAAKRGMRVEEYHIAKRRCA
jgi:hypothetical protein